ncbi:MAG: hypothetical protein SGPRY_011318 [Prymnesium sp.]
MTASPSHPPSTSLQQLIEASLARRFPPRVADASDVVGLTISSLRQVERGSGAVVMLCVDLTESVLQEAINLKADQIICYSPVPSRPLARLSMDEIDGRIALHCASHAIAVHSLHSACAHAARGMLDWLGGSLAAGQLSPIVPHNEVEGAGRGRLLHTERALPLSELVLKLKPGARGTFPLSHTSHLPRTLVLKLKVRDTSLHLLPPPISHSGSQAHGVRHLRSLTSHLPLMLTACGGGQELLSVKHLRLALGVSVDEASLPKAQECCFVQSVAIEAGKASVLHQTPANVRPSPHAAHLTTLTTPRSSVVFSAAYIDCSRLFPTQLVGLLPSPQLTRSACSAAFFSTLSPPPIGLSRLLQVYIASEMAHMEVLAANARGVVVILTGQSTIERAYLRRRPHLHFLPSDAIQWLSAFLPPACSLEKELHAEYSRSDWNVKVKCSAVDCSPFAIV